MIKDIPNVAFIGITEKGASYISENYEFKDVIGLRNSIKTSIYPLPLKGFQFFMAIYDIDSFTTSKVKVVDEDNNEVFAFDLEVTKYDPRLKTSIACNAINEVCLKYYPRWYTLITPVHENAFIMNPGEYKVLVIQDNVEYTIGCLYFVYQPAPELTNDRIIALKSNPLAPKSAEIEIKCNSCNDKIQIYTSIEKINKEEKKGAIWYKELPEYFNCKCRKNSIPLIKLKESMHALLFNTENGINDISLKRLYENTAFTAICTGFEQLLKTEPNEEEIQNFIERYPIILQQFAAEKIFYKLPIMSKYKTDICIVNNKKELLLIEIEKPNTRILKRGGGVASELQHALDQVRDWLYDIDEHKLAVLDCIGLKNETITKVRGIVIAGRDTGYDISHLQKLKWTDFGNITFNTYDDILNGLVNLVKSIKGIG